jgi:multidrug resistance efflux pump
MGIGIRVREVSFADDPLRGDHRTATYPKSGSVGSNAGLTALPVEITEKQDVNREEARRVETRSPGFIRMTKARSRRSKSSQNADIDRYFAQLALEAPAVKQAAAKLEVANRDLAQAELDLRYCDILADIDGVVTRRNVNPGDYVQIGRNLIAVRSLHDI